MATTNPLASTGRSTDQNCRTTNGVCCGDYECYVKHDTYSQCRSDCPSGWACAPTPAPSPRPTDAPTVSPAPSAPPTSSAPTIGPSPNPTATAIPTGTPSADPTCGGISCSPTLLPTLAPATTLRGATYRTGKDGFGIGAIYKAVYLEHEEELIANYTQLIRREYNWITAENGCKWTYMLEHDFSRCDLVLEAAQAANASFRGHALVWGKEGSNPDW